MPISEEAMPVISYRQKYRNLKRKLKFLLYENECFQEELRKAQRKLLKVTRDKSFLLDQILQYESIDSSSSDSDATVSSDSEPEHRIEAPPVIKKKKPNPVNDAAVVHHPSIATASTTATSCTVPCPVPIKTEMPAVVATTSSIGVISSIPASAKPVAVMPIPATAVTAAVADKKKKPVRTAKPAVIQPQQSPKPVLSAVSIQKRMVEVTEALSVGRLDGHMTSEEVERHLEARQALRDLLPEKAPLTVPAELFSNEPPSELLDGNHLLSIANARVIVAGSHEGGAVVDDDGLVIDLPE